MAAKKTAAKKARATSTKKTVTQVQRASGSVQAAQTGPKYATIGDVMRAAAKGALPRGAKFEIHSDRAVLVAGSTMLLNVTAGEVARWGLRKAGFKADHAA